MAKIREVAEELFVIYYEGKPLHLVTERVFEWKPTKKVYWTKRAASCGVANLPRQFDRSKIEIKRYVPEVSE